MAVHREENITDNLGQLIDILPPRIADHLRAMPELDSLIEVVLDLGRIPEARLPEGGLDLGDEAVTREDLDHVIARIGTFSGDNRAGIERTLHRISCIRNRQGAVVGLTCRVGRAVVGTIDIMRDLAESGRSILIMGRPGVGKCVVGNTWIFTEQGMRPIAAFSPDQPDPESFHPLDLGVATLNGVERTSHFYYDGVRATIKVTSRMGYSLEGTGNHPVLIMGPDGELVFKPLSNVVPGDYLAIQRGQQLFGTETHLPPFEFKQRTNAKDTVLPTELTPELARYLGYLVAEGTTTYHYVTGFCQENAEVANDVAGLVEQLFGLQLKPQVRHDQWNGRDYRIEGRKHRAFLAHLGIDYVRAAEKRIPDCILKAPKPAVAEFLRGYFEGEGAIGAQYGIEVASASETLMCQLHVLLLNFGVVAKLRARINKRNQRPYYYLNIKGANVSLFEREIGFVSTKKRALLAGISAIERNPNLDVIPYQVEALLALREQVALSQTKSHQLVGSQGRTMPSLVSGYRTAHPMLSKYTRTAQSPSYATLRRILDETAHLSESPIRQRLRALCETGFYFDTVSIVESGMAPVYDFTVPGSHTFCGNGLVNHNTTKLRELARVLSTELKKRVIVIDTSNEIAGDGDIPHPAIGRARRMQVPSPERQHAVMIEAVENHMPEVIVIDEIGTEQEALAARTIAERGVQLIGTAHGNSLENLLMNPTLSDLVGGIQTVTLSDEEARRRGTQKSILERKAPPTFDIAIELQDRDRMAVHQDVADVIDQMLRGYMPNPEIRQLTGGGEVQVIQAPQEDLSRQATAITGEVGATIRIFPYAVSRSQLERVVRSMRMPVEITRNLNDADAMLILKAYVKSATRILSDAEERQIPTYIVKANTIAQIQKSLREVMHLDVQYVHNEEDDAMREARQAIDHALASGTSVELRPRSSHIRRLQHELAAQYQLTSQSMGEEPNRRVLILPADLFED
ncbi:MAG TPA: LAGLIDADG family homing endonuclease [Stenomitos sp.]